MRGMTSARRQTPSKDWQLFSRGRANPAQSSQRHVWPRLRVARFSWKRARGKTGRCGRRSSDGNSGGCMGGIGCDQRRLAHSGLGLVRKQQVHFCRGAMGVLRLLEGLISRSKRSVSLSEGGFQESRRRDELQRKQTPPAHRRSSADDGLRRLWARAPETLGARDRGTRTRRGSQPRGRLLSLEAERPAVAGARGCRSRPRWE